MPCACFYCDTPLTQSRRWDKIGPRPPNQRTRDHIFPKSAVKRLLCLFDERWRYLNCVDACPDCNARKANMSPLAWLPLIPDPAARQRFAARLSALGVPADAIGMVLPEPVKT